MKDSKLSDLSQVPTTGYMQSSDDDEQSNYFSTEQFKKKGGIQTAIINNLKYQNNFRLQFNNAQAVSLQGAAHTTTMVSRPNDSRVESALIYAEEERQRCRMKVREIC